MKYLTWIYSELNHNGGYFASYRAARTIIDSTNISTSESLAKQVRDVVVDDNLRYDAAVSSFVGSELSLWFHAGWHDQASLEVFECKKGTFGLSSHMLTKLDQTQPDENGDMVFGFASIDADWVFLAELSRERRMFRAEIRAANDAVADLVCGRLAQARRTKR